MSGERTTIRLTMAQALVRHLVAQRIEGPQGEELPLFGGVFAIFGHGNVTCLGEALEPVTDVLPTWRGQHEGSMAMAATAYARAVRRRQVMIATSSIGPGALNMVTAAGVALANRIPLLLIAGDTFVDRIPDPVLQQVEHFDAPGTTVNDAFRPVVRFWDRITHPAQLMQSLPQAIGVLLDPADTGPVFLGLPQDVQEEAYDYPGEFFLPTTHRIRRQSPDARAVDDAASVLRSARRPLLIAGGGVRYSEAEETLARFAVTHGIPVCETVAGKGSLAWDHTHNLGPIGVTGSTSANTYAGTADVVVAVGTRMQDFTTGSWSVFGSDPLRLVSINVARHDAVKHRATQVVGDARLSLDAISVALGAWQAPAAALAEVTRAAGEWRAYADSVRAPSFRTATGLPSYAQVIGVINDLIGPDDYVVAAAGGLPGELNKLWRASGPGSFDCEYGFSCMGYEIAGAWGAAMAGRPGDVVGFCGDGSYMMLSQDIYSSVLSGHKMIVILCDNGGYSVIQRLQESKGGRPFNNRYDEGTRRARAVEPDYAAHAASMGARVATATSLDELAAAFREARSADRTTVIVIRTDPYTWTGGDAWWDVGVPEVSERPEVQLARKSHEEARSRQRRGV